MLAALPQIQRDRVLSRCEPVALRQDTILSQPGDRQRHIYFPMDCFVSLLAMADDDEALAVSLVGSEGVLGVSPALGRNRSPLRARVEGSGNALRMTVADFNDSLMQTPELDCLLQQYIHSQLAQMSQTAACAVSHQVSVRLACWLLMAHDRAHADRFYLTHDRLARLLGVRRSGVSTAAGVLQRQKLIRYTRGHIVILDRKGLEQASCGCYAAARAAFEAEAVVEVIDDAPTPAGKRRVRGVPRVNAPAPVRPLRPAVPGATTH